MANENDDVLKANQGAPAADIPDLKKKDKERKKGGAAWSGARGGAGSFSGATGGTVARAAASAAGSAAEAGEAGLLGAAESGGAGMLGAAETGAGGVWGSISEFISGLTATLAGKLALTAAAMLVMGGAGLAGLALMRGSGRARSSNMNLGGITDSMRIHSGGRDRLGFVNDGSLRFGGENKAKPAAAPKVAQAAPKPKVEPQPDASKKKDAENAGAPLNRLAHNLSGAKLSSSLGGDFGNKNIFSGSSVAPKFNAGMSQVNLPHIAAQKGVLGNKQASRVSAHASSLEMGRGRSSRALGQLRLAKGMSMLGAGSHGETAAADAAGAFDQQQPTNGNLSTPSAPQGVVDSPSGGTGAPDTSMPGAPATAPNTVGDPSTQNMLNQIGAMADQAGQMQKKGEMMLVIGMALIALGKYLCGTWIGATIGVAIMLIGAMVAGMGYMMEQMASQMAAMAKQMGQQVASRVGTYQGDVVNYCTDQALQGTSVSNCQPPDSMTHHTDYLQNQQQDLQYQNNATQNSTPVIDNGKGSGGGSGAGTTGTTP